MAADGAGGAGGQKVDPRVLRARLDRERAQLAAVAGGTVEQAWDMALRRAAQDTVSLRIEVESCRLRLLSLTELLELPGARSLIGILDGPAEAMGVIVLSPEVLSGLVEVQTIGSVTTHAPMARKPTRTDAAMVAGFIDCALAELEMALVSQPEQVWAGGFRYASFLDDPRPLALMLEDAKWQVAEAEVSLGGGAKAGRVLLGLPAVGRGANAAQDGVVQAAQKVQFNADLRAQLQQAPVTLDAVLVRIELDLAALMALRAEDVLPLFGASLDTVQLSTEDGRRMATARLGQARGMRALRISRLDSEPPGDLPVDPMLASAQQEFVARGEQGRVPATAPHDGSSDPTPMSDLVSGLMSDIGDTQFPPLDAVYDAAFAGGG
ncbi:MAG: FliM/FliN family flagellar motor switch protein [Paracoccaceae bacterium]